MSEIHDFESAQNFSGSAAVTATMEAEDALSAAESTAVAAEFSGQTVARVGEELAVIESGIATMAMLNVDQNSLNAFHEFHEAGLAYQAHAAAFAHGLAELTAAAAAMSGAAAAYHEAGAHAFETINAEQGVHNEASLATGHGGADGTFFGVEGSGAVLPPGAAPAPALPVS